MAVELHHNISLARDAALSNTLRNRVVAFAPIAVALIGIGIMAATGPKSQDTLITAVPGIDQVMTGSIIRDGEPVH